MYFNTKTTEEQKTVTRQHLNMHESSHMVRNSANPDREIGKGHPCLYVAKYEDICCSYHMNGVELLLKFFLKKFTAYSAHGFLLSLMISLMNNRREETEI